MSRSNLVNGSVVYTVGSGGAPALRTVRGRASATVGALQAEECVRPDHICLSVRLPGATSPRCSTSTSIRSPSFVESDVTETRSSLRHDSR